MRLVDQSGLELDEICELVRRSLRLGFDCAVVEELPPPTVAAPPGGVPWGGFVPALVESSTRLPCEVIVLVFVTFKKTVVTCSLLFDVLPCPTTSRVSIPFPPEAPMVIAVTPPPELLGSAVPMLRGARVTV